ncbi:MAG: UDP-3-O-(3-hydroxymyristoyl)glucosamine N-acyltransferase [Planctomycetota bacterium]|nr:MAG: UDP-3-O-(3-hydroxymyristoyl)glucosamine N-acyltransferase [Planctomycetota bacterium]
MSNADSVGAPLSAEEVAALVGGRAEGGAGLQIRGVNDLAHAGPHEAAFVAAGRDLQGRDLGRGAAGGVRATRAGLLLAADGVDTLGRACVRVAQPALAAARLAQHFHPGPPRYAPGVHPAAVVEPGAALGSGVSVGPQCVVRAGARLGDGVVLSAGVCVGERCEIGAGSYLHPGVVLYPGVRIGRGCTIHANSVIGSDGFGYIWDGSRHYKVPQLGTVEIGDECEIGAGVCIDRGTFAPTRLGRGCVVDNQVQIGHNCELGDFVVLCGHVGLAGSTRIGDGSVFGAGAASAGHVTIGKGVRIGAWSAVAEDIPDGAVVAGAPAWDLREELRARALWRQMVKRERDKRRR